MPCAADLACQETVAILCEAAVVVGAAARLVASNQHLDFVPKQVGLSSWELVVPVVQWLDR